MSVVRVAVASVNGQDIDQSLAEASHFRIYDVGTSRFEFVESREEAVPAAGRSVEALLDTIADCSILLVRELGGATGGKLRVSWVTVWEVPTAINKALGRLGHSPLFRQALLGPDYARRGEA
jgi:predicted Fe-Mo cluster-binding NifX family protein